MHANRVAAQLQMMSHKDLVLLQDEGLLTSSVGTLVLLRFGSEAETNGMCNSNKMAKGERVMMKLRAYVCLICSFFKVAVARKRSRDQGLTPRGYHSHRWYRESMMVHVYSTRKGWACSMNASSGSSMDCGLRRGIRLRKLNKYKIHALLEH